MLNLITTKQPGEKKNDKNIKKTINNVYSTQLTTITSVIIMRWQNGNLYSRII